MGDDAQNLPSNRREQILKRLRLQGSIRTAALAEELGVTPITIRRDISELEQEGLVTRVRGGARLATQPQLPQVLRAGATIGFIAPSLDFYWPSIIEGANLAADEIGARVLLQGSTFSARDNLSQVRQLIEQTQVDALAVVPDVESGDSEKLIRYLEELTIPVVLVEREASPRSFTARGLDSVAADHRRGGEMCVQYLLSLRHSEIALLLDKAIPSRHAIATGYEEALRAGGFEPALRCDTTQVEGGERLTHIKAFATQCIAKGVTAIVVHSDEAALLILESLLDSGVSVPEDISIVAYDDELAAIARPALSAVAPPKQALGRYAIRTLATRLTSPNEPCTHLLIEPTLVIRDSTGPAPSRH